MCAGNPESLGPPRSYDSKLVGNDVLDLEHLAQPLNSRGSFFHQSSPARHSAVNSDVVPSVAGVRGSLRIITCSSEGVGSTLSPRRIPKGPCQSSHPRRA
jgi:hypothetical protein